MPFKLGRFVRALFKGVGHRYIKRIPYMTPKGQRYRYIYKVEHTHRGKHAFDEAHLVEGTKFALSTESGAEFHGHITAVDGDKVTYTIDDGPQKGEVVETTKAELAAKLNEVHGYKDKLSAERAKVSALLEEMKAGSATEKQIARVRRRLLALGGVEKEAENFETMPEVENHKRRFPLFREEPKSRRLNARIRELEREVLAANRAVDKQPHYIDFDDLPKSEEEERLWRELHEIYSEFRESESKTKPLSRAALQRMSEIQDALLPAKKRAERASQVARDKKDRLSIEASRIREKAEREHYDLTTYHDLALPSEREPDEKPYEYMRREGERLIKLAEARKDIKDQEIRDRAYLGESKVPRNPAVTRYNEERRNKELAEGRRLLRVADSEDPQAQERKRIEDILRGLEYTAEGESDVTRAGKRTASSRKRDGVLQDYIRDHVRTLEPSRERADLEAAAQAYKDAEHDKTRERRKDDRLLGVEGDEMSGLRLIPVEQADFMLRKQEQMAEFDDKDGWSRRATASRAALRPYLTKRARGVRLRGQQLVDEYEPGVRRWRESGRVTKHGTEKRASYREGGTFTHEGIEYDLDKALTLADRSPTRRMKVSDLDWVLKYDTPDPRRVARADTSAPLLVSYTRDGRPTVIDGLHRLTKAKKLGKTRIAVRTVPLMDLRGAAMTKQAAAPRDYKREYRLFHSSPEAKRNRAKRNLWNRRLKGKVPAGYEIDHKRQLRDGGRRARRDSPHTIKGGLTHAV